MKKKIYRSKLLESILYFSGILHLAGGVMIFSSQESAYLYLKVIYGYNFEMTIPNNSHIKDPWFVFNIVFYSNIL